MFLSYFYPPINYWVKKTKYYQPWTCSTSYHGSHRNKKNKNELNWSKKNII